MKKDLREYRRQWQRNDAAMHPEKYRARQRARFGVYPTRPCPDVCEVCSSPPTAKKTLCADHDHLTGTFRGWICHNCNSALGLLKDSSDRCIALARYLRREEL